jgi:hypothetical protein
VRGALRDGLEQLGSATPLGPDRGPERDRGAEDRVGGVVPRGDHNRVVQPEKLALAAESISSWTRGKKSAQ